MRGKPAGRFRIILMEPEYGMNVGAVARAMKNFGFSELCIVSPKCDPTGFDAIKFSKHAREVLEGAKIVRSLAAATKGCRLVVGTTGVYFRHWNETIRSPIGLKDLKARLERHKEGRVALVFGGEGTGLSEKDVSFCDFLVTIPASGEYPILNLSHAVAIMLYELSGLPLQHFHPAGGQEKRHLEIAFGLIVDRFSSELRNARKVKIAFRRMVGKSMLTDKECASVHGILRRANWEIGEGRKRPSPQFRRAKRLPSIRPASGPNSR